MFGRQPDDEGLAYWLGRWKAEIAEGKPGVRVLFEIENAARGSSNQNDVDALQNKAEIAAKFTNDFIASGAEWTDADFSKAKDIVDGVDHTPESVQQAEEKIVEFIQEKMDPDGGQAPGPVNPGPITPPPLSEAVNALNGASTVDAVLDVLEEYKDALFGSNSSYLLFDALPDGAGRQQAIALGILEQQSYFGKFTSDSNAQATVDLFTKTESNKAAFITAIDSAGSQEAMVSALSLSQALADDRQNLINQWGTSSSATARARAVELQTDSYTVQMSHLAAISGEAQLNLIAAKLLSSPGSFYGVVNIVNALKAIDFTKVNTASGDFLIGGQQYNYIALGTGNDDDTITFPMGATKAAMNIKLYSEGVEKIWSSHIGIIDVPRTPDIDLKGAMGLKELWTDISSADSSDGVNYTNASFDTVFGVSGSTALYNIIRVRFDNTTGENNAKFAVSESKPGSYFTTGDIDGVEQITFDIREGNEGGRIEVHGPDLRTLTVTGNNEDGSGQMEFVSWATKLDLFDASAATANIKFNGPQAAGFQIKAVAGTTP